MREQACGLAAGLQLMKFQFKQPLSIAFEHCIYVYLLFATKTEDARARLPELRAVTDRSLPAIEVSEGLCAGMHVRKCT